MSSKHFFHKNLSIQDGLHSRRSSHASSTISPLPSPAFPPPPSPTSLSAQEEEEEHTVLPQHRQDEAKFYQQRLPTRSQSQRTSPANSSYRPTIHLSGPSQEDTAPGVNDSSDSYYQQQPAPTHQKEEQRKRRFFGLGNSSIAREPATTGGNKLGRSISVRRPPQAVTETSKRHPSGSSSSTLPPPTIEGREVQDGGNPSHLHSIATGPSFSEKDSPQSTHPPPLAHSNYPYDRPPLQRVVSGSSGQQPLEQQRSPNSAAWENTVASSQQHHHRRAASDDYQQPGSYEPSPSSATSTSSHQLQQQPLSYHQPTASGASISSHNLPFRAPHGALQHYHHENKASRPSSQQSFGPPSPLQPQFRVHDNYQPMGTNQASGTHNQGSMGPPVLQQPQNSRSVDQTQQSQPAGLNREGSGYQPYHQGGQGQAQPPNAPPQYSAQLGVNNSQGNSQGVNNYQGNIVRGLAQSSPMAPQAASDQGRSTPPPSRPRDDLASLDIAQLLSRHDELQDKYRKVKKYYFDKDAQVQQLQNTLAHQRLSQSRTSLDDNEYANRFSRLDGAINNLSFNIRRDWHSVPPWLAPQVNKDAPTTATKEMTAVGRACISRWLVDELLDRYFHPSLDPPLSAQLKIIEKNLRRFAAPTPSDEEKDALLARISNWRLATLDGLTELLVSAQAAEYRATLTESLVEKLSASLTMNLKDPPPPGLESSVAMIIELAVGIAANLPLESRDVFVEYILPGAPVNEAYMKVETGLPQLTYPGEGHSESGTEKSEDVDGGKDGGSDEGISQNDTGLRQGGPGGAVATGLGKDNAARDAAAATGSSKKKGMFGGFIGGKKGGAMSGGSGAQQQQQMQMQQREREREAQLAAMPKEERVRFSAFMAVEVRGRSVLVKAPVYTALV